MYSVGVVLWELWSGREPWEGLYGQGLHRVLVVEKQSLPLGEEHRDIAQLLRSSFSPHPEHRPSAKQVYYRTHRQCQIECTTFSLQVMAELKQLQG